MLLSHLKSAQYSSCLIRQGVWVWECCNFPIGVSPAAVEFGIFWTLLWYASPWCRGQLCKFRKKFLSALWPWAYFTNGPNAAASIAPTLIRHCWKCTKKRLAILQPANRASPGPAGGAYSAPPDPAGFKSGIGTRNGGREKRQKGIDSWRRGTEERGKGQKTVGGRQRENGSRNLAKGTPGDAKPDWKAANLAVKILKIWTLFFSSVAKPI